MIDSHCQVFKERNGCKLRCSSSNQTLGPTSVSRSVREKLAECQIRFDPTTSRRSMPYKPLLYLTSAQFQTQNFDDAIADRMKNNSQFAEQKDVVSVPRFRTRTSFKVDNKDAIEKLSYHFRTELRSSDVLVSISELRLRIIHLFSRDNKMYDLVFGRVLGTGAYGMAILIVNKDNPTQQFAVKLQFSDTTSAEWHNEFSTQRTFYRRGLTVKPIAMSVTEFPYIILMSKIDRILRDRLQQDIMSVVELQEIYIGLLNLINRICENQVFHHDFHFGNIGIMYNVERRSQYLILLDFGRSVGVKKGVSPLKNDVAVKNLAAQDCRRDNYFYVDKLVTICRYHVYSFNYEWLFYRFEELRKALVQAQNYSSEQEDETDGSDDEGDGDESHEGDEGYEGDEGDEVNEDDEGDEGDEGE